MTTNRCNLKCAHCYQDADECDSRELSTEEARTMISQIARAGFKIMIFSGGEPLMRDDIFEPVAHAASCGLRPVFGSNGTLITPEIARKLKEAGACAMGISIDSLDAEKHDIFRGVPGAHAATLAGIEACKSVGLPFQIHTTVVDRNRNEICDITRFAKELGAMNHSVFWRPSAAAKTSPMKASTSSKTSSCSPTSCAPAATQASRRSPRAHRSSCALQNKSACKHVTRAAA